MVEVSPSTVVPANWSMARSEPCRCAGKFRAGADSPDRGSMAALTTHEGERREPAIWGAAPETWGLAPDSG
jgi:hypothetical protein